jgi:hypothetical protein
MLPWLQLFCVGDPDTWTVALAGLDICPAALAALGNVTGELVSECIEDDSPNCLLHTAQAESDVAGVRTQPDAGSGAEPGYGDAGGAGAEPGDGGTGSSGSAATPELPSFPLTANIVFLDSPTGDTRTRVQDALETVLRTINGTISSVSDEGDADVPLVFSTTTGSVPAPSATPSVASSATPAAAAAPPPDPAVPRLRSVVPVSNYSEFGRTIALAYPHMFYNYSAALMAQQGPFSSTFLTYLMEQGSSYFGSDIALVYDLTNARDMANINASGKARLRFMDASKVDRLVKRFSSPAGLAELTFACAHPEQPACEALITDVLRDFKHTGNSLPFTNAERRLARGKIIGLTQLLGPVNFLLTIAPNDANNPLALRLTFSDGGCAVFPAEDAGYAEYLGKPRCTWSEAVVFAPFGGEAHCVAQQDLLRRMAGNPIAAARISHHLIESLHTAQAEADVAGERTQPDAGPGAEPGDGDAGGAGSAPPH